LDLHDNTTNSIENKYTIATWSDPDDGNIVNTVNDAYIRKLPSGDISIRYEEQVDPDANAPKAQCDLLVKKSGMISLRKGAYNSKMTFETGKETNGEYVLPYGKWLFKLFTESYSCDVREVDDFIDYISINLRYNITPDGSNETNHASMTMNVALQ